MEIKSVDAMARQIAVVSRRGTFRAVGGAALTAGLAAPAVTHAGKNGQKRCKRQREQCRAYLETFCEPTVDPAACEEAGAPCCEPFARCNAGSGIACLFEAVLGVPAQARSRA